MMQLRRRLRFLFRRAEFERALDEEMRFHLDMRTQENMEAGLPPEEARWAALRRFGNVMLLKEVMREMWGLRWLETLWQDLRYGLRMLRRSPAFTAVAVLSLALGIGANTAIFSIMDALLMRMLPVKNPEELVCLRTSVSFPAYKKLRDRNQSFSGLAVIRFMETSITVNGEAEPAYGQMVTGNYYATLGVNAVLGRALSPEDDQVPGVGGPQGPVAVISYDYWKRRFALDPSVVGKAVTINGVPVKIVGVTPPEFFGAMGGTDKPVDITVPIMLQPRVYPVGTTALWLNGQQGSELEYDGSDEYGWRPMIARLKPGVTMAQAQAELNVLFQQVLAERAGSAMDERRQRENAERKLELTPAGKGLFAMVPERPTALLLLAVMAAPGLVLLIACANVANLLLARAAARQKEVAVRLAIGAGRSRLIRQFLTESVLLALMGGAIGVALASWGRNLLLAWISNSEFLFLRAETDTRALVFTAAATMAAGIMFGLAPAFRAAKANLATMLKDVGVSARAGRRRWEPGKVLVVAQVALSLPLLIGAGLLARSIQNMRSFDTGFNRENLLLFTTEFLGSNKPRSGALIKEIGERMVGIPGARAVGLSHPPGMVGWMKVSVEGAAPLPEGEMFASRFLAGPGYLEAVGIPLLAGRDLSTRDNENAPKVCVVSAALAGKFFPNTNPIGRRLTFPRPGADYQAEIVGVVKDVRPWRGAEAKFSRTAYCPILQDLPASYLTLEVRAAGNLAPIIPEVRRRFQDIDRNLLLDVKTWDALTDGMQFDRIWLSRLASGLGMLALLLACVGLYGLMAYSVARRTNEIGIRMALGAERGDVIRMVLRETLWLVLIGIAVGLAASQALTKIISSMLFGVKTTDLATLSVATALLLGVALFAGYLPARRASRLDPIVALRHE
ncbi:MAG: ABC transporter permease [Acidobacteria bacterium]|nr:ABC transporter permease [Acidobacteriota bacterium]